MHCQSPVPWQCSPRLRQWDRFRSARACVRACVLLDTSPPRGRERNIGFQPSRFCVNFSSCCLAQSQNNHNITSLLQFCGAICCLHKRRITHHSFIYALWLFISLTPFREDEFWTHSLECVTSLSQEGWQLPRVILHCGRGSNESKSFPKSVFLTFLYSTFNGF